MDAELKAFISSQIGEDFKEAQLISNNSQIIAFVESGTLRGLPEDLLSFENMSSTASIMAESGDIESYKKVDDGYILSLKNNLQIDVIYK